MSGTRNLPGTPSYSMPNADRPSPAGKVTMPRELWARSRAEAKRRGLTHSELVREALLEYLPRSVALPKKSS